MTYTTTRPVSHDRCHVHDTPAAICDGPHAAHVCTGDQLVITAPDVRDCSCGWRR